MSLYTPSPSEINAMREHPVYSCRACRKQENLQWFRGTSCPVCTDEKCWKELSQEFAAYEQQIALENENE